MAASTDTTAPPIGAPPQWATPVRERCPACCAVGPTGTSTPCAIAATGVAGRRARRVAGPSGRPSYSSRISMIVGLDAVGTGETQPGTATVKTHPSRASRMAGERAARTSSPPESWRCRSRPERAVHAVRGVQTRRSQLPWRPSSPPCNSPVCRQAAYSLRRQAGTRDVVKQLIEEVAASTA
jgi:hypothetical protein